MQSQDYETEDLMSLAWQAYWCCNCLRATISTLLVKPRLLVRLLFCLKRKHILIALKIVQFLVAVICTN